MFKITYYVNVVTVLPSYKSRSRLWVTDFSGVMFGLSTEDLILENNKKSKKVVIIIIMAVLVLLAVSAVVVMAVFKSKEHEITAEEHMENAVQFMEDEEYGKAVSAYDKAIDLDKTNINAYLGKIKAYEALGYDENIRETINDAIAVIEDTYDSEGTVPDNAEDIYYYYADMMVADGDNMSAEQLLSQGSEIIQGLLDNYTNPDFAVHNDSPVMTSDTEITFGLYPDREITGNALTVGITEAEYDDKGIAEVKGIKYFRYETASGMKYYIMNDIKWDIINETDDSYLLMTHYAIDAVPYNTEYTAIDWDNSSLRKWLNEDFYSTAFNDVQKSFLTEMTVTSTRNPDYGIYTGNNVTDYVTVLSAEEVSEGANGFAGDRKAEDADRSCEATEFGRARGIYTDSNGICRWWLRTCGVDTSSAMFVNTNGVLACDGYYVIGTDIGVRPVITISKSSVTE